MNADTNYTAKQALSDAADLIDRYGHVKGWNGSNASGYCAIGAIGTACWLREVGTPREILEDSAYKAFLTWLRAATENPKQLISDWNDRPSRPAAEVSASLRRCAAAL